MTAPLAWRCRCGSTSVGVACWNCGAPRPPLPAALTTEAGRGIIGGTTANQAGRVGVSPPSAALTPAPKREVTVVERVYHDASSPANHGGDGRVFRVRDPLPGSQPEVGGAG